jgi:ADP-glucose pyrophosphorylase
MDDLAGGVTVLILGGGRGTRLDPLTARRSKPAVPIAGKYRLIDIPISNAINSHMERMYVLTQYNSVSLHRHIGRTYCVDEPWPGLSIPRPRSPRKASTSRRRKRLTISGTSAESTILNPPRTPPSP